MYPKVLDHRICLSYAMSVIAIFISAPRQFEWFNFHGKATRTDGATANNVKRLKFSVPHVLGHTGVKAIFISAPRWFELFNFQGKATRTDGTTAENVERLEFMHPQGLDHRI